MDDQNLTRWPSLAELRHRRVSFAQNFEDILLGRALDGPEGFYIDVGANHPVFHSVTKAFYDRGWCGVNIEPHPALHRALAAARPRDVNLNVGLADAPGSLTFYEMAGDLNALSTFHPMAAESYRARGYPMTERTVPVTTLAEVCERHAAGRTIDFLKIDAEFYELQILAGGDWRRWRPRVVVIEANLPELVAQWQPVILGVGYLRAAYDGINLFFVREEDAELLPRFEAPVNAADNAIAYEYLRLLDAPGPRGPLDRLAGALGRLPGVTGLAHRLRRRAG